MTDFSLDYMSVSQLTHRTNADDLRKLNRPAIVMHNNKPVAALVSFEQFLEWQNALIILTPASSAEGK